MINIVDVVYVFQMQEAGELSWHQRIHRHSPGQIEIHYFLEGSGTFQNGRMRYTIQPGSLYISDGETVHSIRADSLLEPLTYYAVLFQMDPDQPEITMLMEKLKASPPLLIGTNYRFFFEEIRDHGLSNEENLRLSACYQLLSLLFRFNGSQHNGDTSTMECIHLEKALRIMQRNVFNKLVLNDICSEIKLADSYFIRMFTKRMHQPPMKYYMGLKMEAAKAMLTSTTLSIKEIAAKLCFSSEFHFSKQFKASTGESPSDYRKTYTNINI